MKYLQSSHRFKKAVAIMQRYFYGVMLLLSLSCGAWSATNPPSGTITVPPRIGVSTDAHNRTVAGSATASPASEAARCTITADSNKVTISNIIVMSGGTITFNIVGANKNNVSETADDVTVTLVHSSAGALATATTCVVIQKRIVTPHQVPSPGTATPNNRLLNDGTSPAFETADPPNVARVTFYGTDLTVQVEDQLKILCGDIYGGSAVTESDAPINQNLRADGSYIDPVGIMFAPDGNNISWPPTSPQALSWPTSLPAPSQDITLNISRAVEVDGFVLTGGTGLRTATLTAGGLLTITWP